MQLKKQSIRHTPTYHKFNYPNGIKRQPADFNQVRNMAQRNRNRHGDTFK